MPFGEAGHAPSAVVVLRLQVRERRGGDDVGVQGHLAGAGVVGGHFRFQFAQPLVQAGLVVVDVGAGVQHPVRFHEHDALRIGVFHPEDEVRVEAALLEEAHAVGAALVAQQEELGWTEPACFLAAVEAQVLHEPVFALVQRRRLEGGFGRALHWQRLVEVPVEVDVRQFGGVALVDALAFLDELLDVREQSGALLRRAGGPRHAHHVVAKVGVRVAHLVVAHVYGGPAFLLRSVEAVHVLLGERQHGFAQRGHIREGLRFGQVVLGDQLVAGRIGGLEDGADGRRREG